MKYSFHVAERSPSAGWLANEAIASLLVVATIIALIFIKFGSLDLALPVMYSDDAPVSFMYIKNLILFGSPHINPTIGMPQGADLHLYPARDLVWIAVIKTLSLWSSDTITVANLYIIVGYAINGLAFYICTRIVGLRMILSALGACVYAFSPFGLRSLMHHSLFPYPAAPIGATLALLMFYTARYPFSAFPTSLRGAQYNWVPPVLGAAIVGASSIYWIAFTYLLVAFSAFCTALSSRSWRPLVVAAVLFSIIGAVSVIAWVPEIHSIAGRFLSSAGSIKETFSFRRSAYEQAMYGLRTLDMMLPKVSNLSFLNKISDPYHSWMRDTSFGGYVAEGADSYLGFAGLSGLTMAGLILAALVPCAGARKPAFLRYRKYIIIGAATNILFAFLFAVPNGLGYAFNYFVTSFIRAQNRISVFVLFLTLVVFYLVVDSLMRRLHRKRFAKATVMGLIAALSLATIADMTPSFTFRGAQASTSAAFLADRDFFAKMQSLLPQGSRILQLPIIAFPEVGITEHMPDYEHFKGYLHTEGFEWSYGALKQTPEFLWQVRNFSDVSFDKLLENANAAGFDAVLIDRRGFADSGAGIISGLTQRLGAGSVLLQSGLRVLIDLRSMKRGQSGDSRH